MSDFTSRREFLKKTAITVALVAVTPASGVLENVTNVFAAQKTKTPPKKIFIDKLKVEKFKGRVVKWLPENSDEAKKLMLPKIHLPLIAQNGGVVPLTVNSHHPMQKVNYIRAFHVIDFNNPVPNVGSFFLTPENGKAYISTRIKIQQESYVQVLTEYSDGSIYGQWKFIKVTVGGC